MEDVKIILSVLWIATMFIYQQGDLLRIYAGDMKAGKMGGVQETREMWLAAAILMLIPIVMVFLSLTLDYPVNRWANIIVAIFWFGFNLIGLPGYPGAYDKFLLIASMGFNALTVWYAWKWV